MTEVKGYRKYISKTQRLTAFLILEGFDWLATVKDRNNPNKVVFIFKDCPELRDSLVKYSSYKENYDSIGIEKGYRKYISKTQRLTTYLIKQGFKWLGTVKDKFNEDKVVFIFEDTQELRDSLGNYGK